MTVSRWQKGEYDRLYVNGFPFGEKAWFEAEKFYDKDVWTFKTKYDYKPSTNLKEAMRQSGENLLTELLGVSVYDIRGISYAELVELVESKEATK